MRRPPIKFKRYYSKSKKLKPFKKNFSLIRKEKISENELQIECNNWIESTYPELSRLFFFNSLQGLKLNFGQIRKVKLNGGLKRSLLDFEFKKNNGVYSGIAIELKKSSPFLKNGELRKDDHLSEQNETMILMRLENWKAEFCWSLEDFKKLIKNYMEGK